MGALKLHKNRQVRRYNVGITAQTKSEGSPSALSEAFMNYLGCANAILCILAKWEFTWEHMGSQWNISYLKFQIGQRFFPVLVFQYHEDN